MTTPDWPKGHRSQAAQLVQQIKQDLRFQEAFDVGLEAEVQTDKELVKVLPCQYCRRPLVVTTFYVLAWAKCSACKGTSSGPRKPGSVEVVQAGGRTEPRLAADLTKTLLNPTMAVARCPVHPDDESHVMELKTVHHNERYGPHAWKLVNGKMTLVQIAPGETVMHQCLSCNAVVSYSTTAVTQFARVNEVKPGKNANRWADELGSREDTSWPVAEDDEDGPHRDHGLTDEDYRGMAQ